MRLDSFTEHALDSPRLLHISVICSFSLLSSVRLYGCTKVRLSIHPLQDIWVVANLGLLHINLIQISVYRYSCKYNLYFSRGDTQEWNSSPPPLTPRGYFQRLPSGCLKPWIVPNPYTRGDPQNGIVFWRVGPL